MTLAWSREMAAAVAVSECRSVRLALSPASTAQPKAVPPGSPIELSPSNAAIHNSWEPGAYDCAYILDQQYNRYRASVSKIGSHFNGLVPYLDINLNSK
jgi:hypothetical protein